MIKPTCLAFLICESVVQDVRSRNKCILNTHNGILAAKFPVVHERLTIFLALTDGHGDQPMRVYLVKYSEHGEQGEPIFQIEGTMKFGGPLDIAELVLECRRVPFPEPGHYAIKLDIAGEFIIERRLQVKLVNPKGDRGGENGGKD